MDRAPPEPQPNRSRLRRAGWVAGLVLALGLAVAVGRIGLATVPASGPAAATWVMTDFYSSAYYPVRAVLDGENPHDRTRFLERYPVANMYAPYLPFNLVLHLPFALLAPRTAGFLYFVLTVALAFGLAFAALRLASVPADGTRVCLVAGLVLLSRPGQWTLLLGQPAILLAVLIYTSLLLADRAPLWSSLALAVASYKPTFGIPVAALMLVVGHSRVVLTGAAIGLALNLPLVPVLAERAGGLSALITSITRGYGQWQEKPVMNPATSPWLIDATSLVSRWAGTALDSVNQVLIALAVMAVAGFALRRLRWAEPAERNVAVGIICAGVLAAGHHVGYDMVLLVAPALALAAGRLPAAIPTWLRWGFAAAYLLPAVNWVATHGALKALEPSHTVWLLLMSINSVCLLFLFLGHVGVALTHRGRGSAAAGMGAQPRWA